MLTLISLFAALIQLQYRTEVLVENWPHYYVRYCFINSFSACPNSFANNFYW